MMLFLRQGSWCACERSCNSATLALEDGVSAYECAAVSQGSFKGAGVGFAKRERAFPGQRRRLLGHGPPFYVVTGDVVGTGSDNEPLLKRVQAHAVVQWDGGGLFNTTGSVQSQPLANHPGFPDCQCLTSDQLDDLERKRDQEEWERLREEAGDEPLDVEF